MSYKENFEYFVIEEFLRKKNFIETLNTFSNEIKKNNINYLYDNFTSFEFNQNETILIQLIQKFIQIKSIFFGGVSESKGTEENNFNNNNSKNLSVENNNNSKNHKIEQPNNNMNEIKTNDIKNQEIENKVYSSNKNTNNENEEIINNDDNDNYVQESKNFTQNSKENNDDNNINNSNIDDNNSNNNNNDNYNNDNKVYKKNINKNVRYEFNYDINNFKNHHNLNINKNEIKNVNDVFKFIKNEKKNYDLKIEEEEKKLTAIFENFNNELYKYKDERKDMIKKSYFQINDKKYFIEENISNILSKILFLNYRLKCKLFIEIPLLKDDNSEDNLKKDSKCENKVNNNENKKEKIQKIEENITKENKNIEKKKKENDNFRNKIIQNEKIKNKIDSDKKLENLNINKTKERKERYYNLFALINEKKFIYKIKNFYYYDNCEPNYLNNNFLINVNNRNVELDTYNIAKKGSSIKNSKKKFKLK